MKRHKLYSPSKNLTKKIIQADLLNSLQLLTDDVCSFYISNLNDYIFILNDVRKLYTIKPNFQRLIELCNTSAPHRTLVVTAKSDETELDYEARIFAPAIGVNEDIACGSVNCSVVKIWAKFLSKNNLQMAYRSVLTDTFNKIGGYQRLTLDNSEITISANVRKVWEKKFIANTEKDLLQKVKSNIAPITQKTTPMLLLPLGNGLIASSTQ